MIARALTSSLTRLATPLTTPFATLCQPVSTRCFSTTDDTHTTLSASIPKYHKAGGVEKSKAGDWKCPTCDRTNYVRFGYIKCVNCESPFDVETATIHPRGDKTPKRPKNPITFTDKGGKKMLTGDWCCHSCGGTNFGKKTPAGSPCFHCSAAFSAGETFVVPKQPNRPTIKPALPPIMTFLKPKLGLLEDTKNRPLEALKWKNSMVGTVSSTKMDKTLVVEVKKKKNIPIYNKDVNVTRKYYVHDERGDSQLNDTVRIVPDRPRSKTKRWRLAEIIDRKKIVDFS